MVQTLLETYLQEIPSRRRDSWNWPLTQLGLGPPSLNKWYFFNGLLDCAAQLFRYLRLEQVSVKLRKTFAIILQESEFEEFRWKIIEIFLICLRPQIESQSLPESLRKFFGLKAYLDVLDLEVEAMARILDEGLVNCAGAANAVSDQMIESMILTWTEQQRLKLVDTSLSSDSERRSSEPTSTLHMRRVSTSDSSANLDRIESCPLRNSPTNVGYAEKQEDQSVGDTQPTSPSSLENICSVPYFTKELASWELDGQVQVHQMLRSSGLLRKGFSHAGLSFSCTMVFFHNATKVCVYPVAARSKGNSIPGWPLEWKYDKENRVVDVSLLDKVVAISTQRALELHRIRDASAISRPPRIIPHKDWDSSGLATYENGSETLVAIGYQRETKTSREGRVFIYRLKISNDVLEKETIVHCYDIPGKDFPKFLQFDDQGGQLTCVTAIKNSVLIWHLGEPNPVVITKYQTRPETDSDGVTSAIIYKSPNRQSYVLCSTSASTERYRSGGEWPFISPISIGDGQVPQSAVHDLVAMKNRRQLIAGAASSKANIYAMLDKSGKVLILQLASHEDGGIHTRDVSPVTLPASLSGFRGSSASSTCLRFDTTGEKLYGVDPQGNLLIASFKPES